MKKESRWHGHITKQSGFVSEIGYAIGSFFPYFIRPSTQTYWTRNCQLRQYYCSSKFLGKEKKNRTTQSK